VDVASFDPSFYFSTEDFARGARRLQAGAIGDSLELLLDAALLVAATFSPAAHRVWRRLALRAEARPGALSRVVGTDGIAGALYLGIVALAREAIALPISAWRDWDVPRSLGISHESAASFLRRWAVDGLAATAALAVLGLGLGAVRRRWPRGWWLAIGSAAAIALLAQAALEPLFAHVDYQVTSLQPGTLRTRLERLVAEQHADAGDLVVVNASRYGSAVNAFSTGFGPTRRLVLTDTLLAMGDEAAAGAVAHELGHRRTRRLPLRLAVSAAALVGFLGLVELLVRFARRRGALSDAQSIPFVLAAATAAWLLLLPVRNARARGEEREADRLELSVRRDYDAYVAEQVAIVRSAALAPDPPPIRQFWTADHPSPVERIGRALWFKERAVGAREER